MSEGDAKQKNYNSRPLSYYTWQRLKKNKLAMAGLISIAFAVLLSILGYAITPDSSPNANEQLLELSIKPPGFEVKILKLRRNEPDKNVGFFTKMFFGASSNYRSIPMYDYKIEDDKLTYEEYTGTTPNNGEKITLNLANIAFPVNKDKGSILKDNIVQYHNVVDGVAKTIPLAELRSLVEESHIENRTYYLGTDRSGRDMLSRLIIGTRISLAVGFISVLISIVIGMVLGALSGYFRGIIDDLIMWLINVVWSIPTLLLVIGITLILGKGFWQVFVAVGLTMWVEVARVIRGQVLSLREKEFIESGKALGFSHMRLIIKHVIPNVVGPVIVISAANFASAILIEAGLSFLGIGAQPPTASWGAMINAHRGYIIVDAAYLAFLPGLAIMIMVLAFVLLGNGLRDSIDSKSMDDDQVMGF